jgi:hypothetical protein
MFQDFRHSFWHSGFADSNICTAVIYHYIADSNICTAVTYHYIAVVYFSKFSEIILVFIFAYCFNVLSSHYYFYLIIVLTAVVLVAIILFRNFR